MAIFEVNPKKIQAANRELLEDLKETRRRAGAAQAVMGITILVCAGSETESSGALVAVHGPQADEFDQEVLLGALEGAKTSLQDRFNTVNALQELKESMPKPLRDALAAQFGN